MNFTLPLPLDGQSLYSSTLLRCKSETASRIKRFRFRKENNELDDFVLSGGLDRGVVIGLSSGSATQNGIETAVGRILYMNLISTTLVLDEKAKILVIDTTGSFSVLHLQKSLKYLLRRENIQRMSAKHTKSQLCIDSQVTRFLERVEISRVFDIEGIWEVLRELDGVGSQNLSSAALRSQPQCGPVNMTEQAGVVFDVETEAHIAGNRIPFEIGDSQSQSSDLEMLSSSPPWPSQLSDLNSKPSGVRAVNQEQSELSQQVPLCMLETASATTLPVEAATQFGRVPKVAAATNIDLIIIDNMTSLITELFFRMERQMAHDTLTTLTRALYTQSSSQNRTVLLLNTLTTVQNNSRILKTQRGVFASSQIPSLGKLFARIPSLHLFVSSIPKTMWDDDLDYAGNEEAKGPGGKSLAAYNQNVNCVQVIEVLKDTCPLHVEQERKEEIADAEANWVCLQAKKEAGQMKNRDQKWCGFEIVIDDSWTAVGIKDVSGLS